MPNLPQDPLGTKGSLKQDMKAQLLTLKDLTKRTGLLQEAQVVQLKHWPYVLFNLKEHETGVDSDTRSITFVLRLRKVATKADKKAAMRLADWVRSLLGNEWKVTVYTAANSKAKGLKKLVSKLLYDGARLEPFEPPPPPGADFKRYAIKDQKAAFEVASEVLNPIVKE